MNQHQSQSLPARFLRACTLERHISLLAVALLAFLHSLHLAAATPEPDLQASAPEQGEVIAWSDIGVRANQDAAGALVVKPSASGRGAVLETPFQRLRAEVEPETGLVLLSTESETTTSLRVSAHARGRENQILEMIPARGDVRIEGDQVHWERPGVTEEFSVSVDGLRQDFLLAERPAGTGDLQLELAVEGAELADATYGARLITADGRHLAYSRLLVVDANGSEMPARMQVSAGNKLMVLVDDAEAVYPLRIDPTFSDEQWVSMGGVTGVAATTGHIAAVSAFAVDADGAIYVGGQFNIVGNIFANNVARWDGNDWTALDEGLGGQVNALAIGSDGALYAGGAFTSAGGTAANYIARWDGDAWTPLAEGLENIVTSLLVGQDGSLYVGGLFDRAGTQMALRVARWDGSSWHPLGTGLSAPNYYPRVNALAQDAEGLLYVGGFFGQADGVTATNIAAWDGSAWSSVGSGVNGTVQALAVDADGNLYAGGQFSGAGGSYAGYIARWDGSTWSALGAGVNHYVNSLEFDAGGNLYVAGLFTSASSVPANRVARWDGSTWSSVGEGRSASVTALAFDGEGRLIAGEPKLGRWDGSQWLPLSSGTDGYIAAAVVDGTGNLFVAGNFTEIGGVAANRIARWDGEAWLALGEGMDALVNQLTFDQGGNLYAGGNFTSAGGVPANRIARWDGSHWSALGSGVDNSVNALAIAPDNSLYVGGTFISAGGVTVNRIARWSGSAWSALGSGMDDAVYSLAFDTDGNLLAGGTFNSAGGVATRFAKWDGSAWSGMGTHTTAVVGSIAVDAANTIYASYSFSSWNSTSRYIGKWNGTGWTSILSTNPGSASALVVDAANNLYAAGSFTNVGTRIARYNGSSWSAMGTGLNSTATALALDGEGKLYVGGHFMLAGEKISPYLAAADVTEKVVYHGNGHTAGNAPEDETAYVAGSTVTVAGAADLERTGYNFGGWNTHAGGKGTNYAEGDTIKIGINGITLYANWAVETFTVSASAGQGGSISWTSQSVEHGQTAALSVTPDTGYSIDSVSGCGGSLFGSTFTTAAVTEDCAVTVNFKLNSYAVSASAGTGGSITPTSQSVDHGSTATITVTPSVGYSINSVSGCGGNLSGNTFTTGVITAACSVEATFSLNAYSVSASASAGGSVTPISQMVSHGNQGSVTLTPAAGYHIAGVSGCGGTVDGNTFTTGTVTGACAITASFSLNQYTVTATAGEGGEISPASRLVDHGTSATFTVTPAESHDLDSVSGCGGTLKGTTYTTGTITEACTVEASFTPKVYTVTATATGSGSIGPATNSVEHGSTATFTVTPAEGYTAVMGGNCGGSLQSNSYTTSAITGDCDVTAQFEPVFNMDDGNGNPLGDQPLMSGDSLTFHLADGSGDYVVTTLPTANGSTGLLVDNGDGSYSFQAPDTGAFAGDYTIVIEDQVSGWIEQVVVTVPLKVELSRSTLLARGERNRAEVTVTGAAPDAVIELSTDGDETTFLPVAEGELLLSTDNEAEGNPAVGAVLAQDHSAVVSFQVLASASGYPHGSSPQAQVIPAASYAGTITNAVGGTVPALVELRMTVDSVTDNLVDEFDEAYEAMADSDGTFTLVGPADDGDYSLRFSAAGYAASSVAAESCPESSPCMVMLDYESTAADPELSPAGGSYTDSVEVNLSTTTAGATLVYTRDGSTPTRSNGEQVESGAKLTLDESITLKVFAFKDGLNDSQVISANYAITSTPAPAPGQTIPPVRRGGGGALDWVLLALLTLVALARCLLPSKRSRPAI